MFAVIHIRTRLADGRIVTDAPSEELHRLLEDAASLTWLDLESPTADELGLVAGILGWSHLTVEDLARQGQRAKLEPYDGYHVLVMHSLLYEPTSESPLPRLATREVDFVIGTRYVATVHYCHLPALTESRDVAEHTDRLLSGGIDFILYTLTDRLVDGYFPVLEAMLDAVEELEDTIVTKPSEQLLPTIFDMKRDAVVMRKALSPQLEVFTRLIAPGYGVVSEDHVYYFRDVHDHLIRVFEASDSYRELMGGALDAYLSTVSNRMNEVMKRLTVMAALFLPITFWTGVFGMNLRETPLWNDVLFWVFLGGMAAVSAVQYWYFSKKGWV